MKSKCSFGLHHTEYPGLLLQFMHELDTFLEAPGNREWLNG
jgi:hypothetical protein